MVGSKALRYGIIAAAVSIAAASSAVIYWREHSKMTVINYLSSDSLQESKTLDTTQLKAIHDYQVLHNLTRPLLAIDRLGNYEYDLAEDISFSEDNRKATIKLRPAFFSDGTPITAKDLENTLKRLIVLGSTHVPLKDFVVGAADLKTLTQDCAGLQVIDAKTFVLHLTRPVADILYYLQMADVGVLTPQQAASEKMLGFDDYKVSSGPYTAFYSDKGERLLKLNPHYTFVTPNDSPIPYIRFVPGADSDAVLKAMKDRSLHFGTIGFRDYLNLDQHFKEIPFLEFNGSKRGGVTVLVLNSKNPKFKRKEVRQWVQAWVFKNLKIPSDLDHVIERAYQYFLPEAPGHMDPAELQHLVEARIKLATSEIPAELKSGFAVMASDRFTGYVPPGFEGIVQSALTPSNSSLVNFDFSGDATKVIARRKSGEFEAFVSMVSMSYKALNEALSAAYTGPVPSGKDPTGRIHKLIDKNLEVMDEAKRAEITREILVQMLDDAEIIPLFYQGYYKFFDHERLDGSDVSFWESAPFHKYKLLK